MSDPARLDADGQSSPPAQTGPPVGDCTRSPELAKVEAILFLSREPLSSRKMAKLANLEDGTQARSLLRRLSALYVQDGSAFRVEEVAGGFQLLTHRAFSSWLRRLEYISPETRLSGPALETLGIVAYRQPVLRAEIESIRGVQCGEILRQLMERDLVRIVGRSEELGRPFQYGTTRRFLRLFGFKHLDDLPRAEEIRRGEIPLATAVANQPIAGHDGRFIEHHKKDQEDKNVTVADAVQDEELLKKLHAAQVLAAYEDDDLDDDEEFEDDDDDLDDDDDDDDDYDYEDDDEEDDDDFDEEDDEEEDDDDEEDLDEELEGDWEEVDDDEDDEEEDDDEDDLDDDEDDDDEDWDDEDDD